MGKRTPSSGVKPTSPCRPDCRPGAPTTRLWPGSHHGPLDPENYTRCKKKQPKATEDELSVSQELGEAEMGQMNKRSPAGDQNSIVRGGFTHARTHARTQTQSRRSVYTKSTSAGNVTPACRFSLVFFFFKGELNTTARLR